MVGDVTNRLFQQLTAVAIGSALGSIRRRHRSAQLAADGTGRKDSPEVRVRSGIAHHPVRVPGVPACSPAARRIEDVLAGTAPVDMTVFEAQFRDARREN
jgi:hypothetical protein